MHIKTTLAAAAAALMLAGAPALAQDYPGYDPSFLDRSVRPQDDFYHFALGGYEKTHPIPPDLSSMGIYPQVGEQVRARLHAILEDLAAHPGPPGSPERKLGDFYRSGMDVAAIQAAGAQPVAPYLARIDKVASREDVARELARLHLEGVGGAFSFSSSPDLKDPTVRIAEAEQGGLGLPSKEYYLDPSPARTKIRQAYQEHVGRIFALFGQSDPQKQAATVLRIETAMAEGSLSPAQLRDPKDRYHPTSRTQLATSTFAWNPFLGELGLGHLSSINLATPGYFVKLDELMGSLSVDDWKTYLRWKLMNSVAAQLSAPFEEEQFEFSRHLSGVPKMPERWKKMVQLCDHYLGMALSKKFVEGNFSPEARARALDMVAHIRAVLRERIATGWMSEATKKEALTKLDAIAVKIGYPDTWKDYSALHIDAGPFFANLMRARAFAVRDDLNKVGKPVDRSEWQTTPATVNAFYDPARNEICFPAGRLQPPFFDLNADDALNYGATGVTMAHEMSHGFDDEGAQFDARGQLRNWWTPEDLARFTQKADSVSAQMSEYSYDGQPNNGKLVEGEAIADQAGVGLAYAALCQAHQGKPVQITRDGFTEAQRFYLGYALCRANHQRPEAAHAQMTRDPHPLGMFRVNGPLSNEPAFFEAFDCKPGDPMRRPDEKLIKLWGP